MVGGGDLPCVAHFRVSLSVNFTSNSHVFFEVCVCVCVLEGLNTGLCLNTLQFKIV